MLSSSLWSSLVLWSAEYWADLFSAQCYLSLKWKGCSPVFISSLNPCLFFTCGLQSCDEQWWLICFRSYSPPTLFSSTAVSQIQISLSLSPFLSFFPLSENTNTIQQLKPLQVRAKDLPGWNVAIVHIGCHHHSCSSPVALETQQKLAEDLIFQARIMSQKRYTI